MSIFLIRHASTTMNARGRLNEPTSGLGDRGRAQAEALAAQLARDGVSRVLTSTLVRARQTADAIAASCGAPIDASPLLNERDFGELCGSPVDAIDGSILYDPPLRQIGSTEVVPPGGESWAEFHARVSEAWHYIRGWVERTSGNLAVVTHSLVLTSLTRHHIGLDEEWPGWRSASVTTVTSAAPYEVVSSDSISHLSGLPAATAQVSLESGDQ